MEDELMKYFKKYFNFKENTIKDYIRYIINLNKEIESKNKGIDIIHDFKLIKEFLNKSNLSNGTKYNYLNIITKIFKFDDVIVLDNDKKEKYINLMNEYKNLKNDVYLDNKIDESKFISEEEFKNIPDNFWKNKKVKFQSVDKFCTIEEFENIEFYKKRLYLQYLTDYTILFLYTQRPPLRLDYYYTKVYTKEDNINIEIKKKEDRNFILWNNNYMTLYINDYKNVIKLGKLKFRLENNIYKHLIYYFSIMKHINGKIEYLLYYNKDNANKIEVVEQNLTLSAFSNKIQSLTKKITGKKLSVSDLRKLYESYFISSKEYENMTNRQKNLIHHKLLHSQASAVCSYNKIL